MITLSFIVTAILTVIAALFRVALGTVKSALKAAEVAVTATNRATNVALDIGGSTLSRGVDKSVQGVAESGKQTGKGSKVSGSKVLGKGAKAGTKTAVNGVKAIKNASVVALKLLLKTLRTFLSFLDSVIATLCATSTIVAIAIVMIVVMLLAAVAATVPLSTDMTWTTNLSQVSTTQGVSSSATPTFSGWSSKGKVSAPKYVQWYAPSNSEEYTFRDACMRRNGTGSGDWANLPYNGGDVAGNACGACALANAVSAQLKQEITPDILVTLFNNKGVCTVSNCLSCTKVLVDKYPEIAIMDLDGTDVKSGGAYSSWNSGELGHEPSGNEAVDMNKVDEWLDKGACLVFSIGPNTSWGGKNTSGHFICCYGRDSDGYYVTDSRGFTTGYELDVPYKGSQVFTGGVQGPFVVIAKNKLS